MQTSEIVIQPASEVPLHEFVRALNLAYADYYVHISHTVDSFRSLVAREAVRLEASIAAIANQRVIGMGLLAVRDTRGWIGGVGIIPRFRGQGVGRMVMTSLIEQARHLQLETVQLEVIRQNTIAFDLYESLGFEPLRELLVFYRSHSLEPPPIKHEALGLTMRRVPAYSALEVLPGLINVRRPWQREISGLSQMVDHIEGLGAWDASNNLVGAAVYRAEGGQIGIMDVAAVAPVVGNALFTQILNRGKWNDISYVNVSADDPLLPLVLENGFEENLGQYEMLLTLNTKDDSQ